MKQAYVLVGSRNGAAPPDGTVTGTITANPSQYVDAAGDVAVLVNGPIDGTAERSILLIAGSEPRATLWLNAFDAPPGGETIVSISVTWGRTGGGSSNVPVHAPTTVLLYQDDPSNDGDPRTATLLVSQVLDNGAPLGSIDTGVFLDVPIPPTTVSGTFFVAALYPDPGQGFPAPLDTTDPDLPGRSWVFSNVDNAVNVGNLGGPGNFGGLIEDPPFGLPGNWLLRATGVGGGTPVPTVSEWGLGVMSLIVLAAGSELVRRRRAMGSKPMESSR